LSFGEKKEILIFKNYSLVSIWQRVNHVLGFTLLRFFMNRGGGSIVFLLRRVFLPRW
jgi:hypothetical protein